MGLVLPAGTLEVTNSLSIKITAKKKKYVCLAEVKFPDGSVIEILKKCCKSLQSTVVKNDAKRKLKVNAYKR